MKTLPRSVGCPVELALIILGGKWTPVILARLKERPLRYGELRRAVPQLSDKMLTERLRELEAQGLVERDGPQPGGYSLSARGETLRPVLQALFEWGESQAKALGIALR